VHRGATPNEPFGLAVGRQRLGRDSAAVRLRFEAAGTGRPRTVGSEREAWLSHAQLCRPDEAMLDATGKEDREAVGIHRHTSAPTRRGGLSGGTNFSRAAVPVLRRTLVLTFASCGLGRKR
jgi:hypothetical protein